ncbi:hypothetical protein LCGC14_1178950 [marine sediment metagenome]|uniref:Uncharacterized protein n=1 Tax=marine sediment metagenome TaxID=412755 RepID=A0A0F9MAJ8_9ZZZZ
MLILFLVALISSFVSVVIAGIGWKGFKYSSAQQRSDTTDMAMFISGSVLVIFGIAAITFLFFAAGILFFVAFP